MPSENETHTTIQSVGYPSVVFRNPKTKSLRVIWDQLEVENLRLNNVPLLNGPETTSVINCQGERTWQLLERKNFLMKFPNRED